jgi:hypothetical protein
MFFHVRQKTPDSQAKVFFFLGIVLTALLAMIIAQASIQKRNAIGEAPPFDPDFQTLLPQSAVVEADAIRQLSPAAEPTYAVGYSLHDRGRLAVISWEARGGKYKVSSDVSIDERHPEMTASVKSVTEEHPSKGTPSVIAVFTEAVSTADYPKHGAYFFARSGGEVRRLAIRMGDGTVDSFAIQAENIADVLRVQDVTGDGAEEVVFEPENVALNPGGGVYAFAGNELVLDQQLSWAMQMSARLFPEPPSNTASE